MSKPQVIKTGHDNVRPVGKPWDDDPLWGIDPLIKRYVQILVDGGVETFESCQGGEGHCGDLPWIRFHGQRAAGWHALSVAQNHALPVLELLREWPIIDGEPSGPKWRMVFLHADPGPAQTFEQLCELQKESLPHD